MAGVQLEGQLAVDDLLQQPLTSICNSYRLNETFLKTGAHYFRKKNIIFVVYSQQVVGEIFPSSFWYTDKSSDRHFCSHKTI